MLMDNNLMNITESAFINDIKKIVEQGRNAAYGALNTIMIETYWNIGRRIVVQEQNGNECAEYGKQLIKNLSAELTRTNGRGLGI